MRVFSAVQPSGRLHIGNYTGGLMQFVRLGAAAEGIFCIADLHALTSPQEPAEVRAHTREVAALYLASGLDPDKVTLFVQSHIPAHTQLAWILSCTAKVGELMRMTQFKAKREEAQSTSAGLFEYPILMAADILLYKATHVPVGADQKQHLELARTLARRFNQRYGECFVVPDPLMPEAGARIMALDNPAEKMSKSSPRDDSRLNLLDPPDVLRRKVRSALTDSYQGVTYDPMDRPGLANLLTLYAALSGDTVDSLASRFGGSGHEVLKRSLIDLVVLHLAPIQRRYGEISRHVDYIERVLAEGAARAAAIALPTMNEVAAAVGLLAPVPAAHSAARA